MKILYKIYVYPISLLLSLFMIIVILNNKINNLEFINLAVTIRKYIFIGSTIFWIIFIQILKILI